MKLIKIVTLFSSSLLLASVGELISTFNYPISISANVKKNVTFRKGLPDSFTSRIWGGGEESVDQQTVQDGGYNSATTEYVSSLYKTTVANQYAYITFGDNNQHQVVDRSHFLTFKLVYNKRLGINHYLLSSNKNGKGTVIDYHYYEPNTAKFSGTILSESNNTKYKFNINFRGYDNTQMNEYNSAMGENNNNNTNN